MAKNPPRVSLNPVLRLSKYTEGEQAALLLLADYFDLPVSALTNEVAAMLLDLHYSMDHARRRDPRKLAIRVALKRMSDEALLRAEFYGALCADEVLAEIEDLVRGVPAAEAWYRSLSLSSLSDEATREWLGRLRKWRPS